MPKGSVLDLVLEGSGSRWCLHLEDYSTLVVGLPVIADVKVGARYELNIDAITSEGAGVGRLRGGQVVFVHRTAPGDRVFVEITSVHRRWSRARLLELLKPGPDRRDPLCPHYKWCGGCTVEHLIYPAQLALKGKLVTDALNRIGKRDSLPDPGLNPSPRETRYRNRVTLTLVRTMAGEVTAGFHRLESSGSILDVDGRCLLPEAPIATVWEGLRKGWGRAAHRLPDGPRLRLTLRGVENGDVLLLIEGGETRGDPEALISKVSGLRSIWHRKAGSFDVPCFVAGESRLTEVWYGQEVEVRPTGFLQVNREAAGLLHDHVIKVAGEVRGKRIVDAYCGFGAFGRRLSLDGAVVVGIEVDAEAVRMSMEGRGSSFQVLQWRVEDLLSRTFPTDLVILNPPRIGVGAGVMEGLARARPGRIIYVSCDPATLARDVGRLGYAYRVSRIEVFDLFPQTAHVETVLTLEAI